VGAGTRRYLTNDSKDQPAHPREERIMTEQDELTPEEIGDNLDIEAEGVYPCSDGSITHTISVDKLLKAQVARIKQLYPIMFKEEAELDGFMLRAGWLPPAEQKYDGRRSLKYLPIKRGVKMRLPCRKIKASSEG